MRSSIVHQLKPVIMGAIFTLVAMAFAYAVPHAIQLEPTSDGSALVAAPECPEDDGTVDETTEGDTEMEDDATEGDDTEMEDDATEGDDTEMEDDATEGDDTEMEDDATDDECEDDGNEAEVVEEEVEAQDSEGDGEDHGQVVRVAAHCPIKGRAHGELVRSIAQDKDATVADAEQACADAMTELEASGAQNGKPDKADKPTGKPDRAGEGKGKGRNDDGDPTDEPSGEASDLETSSAAAGSAGRGDGKAKGKSK